MRDLRRTQIGSEKSGADASMSKNRHADNKHAPEDGDLFDRDESASLFWKSDQYSPKQFKSNKISLNTVSSQLIIFEFLFKTNLK